MVFTPATNLHCHIHRFHFTALLHKRNATIPHGEGRSSNRTKWTSTIEIDPPQPPAPHSQSPPPSAIIQKPQTTHSSTTSARDIVWDAALSCQSQFNEIDKLIAHNTARVQRAFRENRIGPHHFAGSTGYGHGDLGRAALDDVMASIMGAESAAVRIQYVSGTHAIASGLFACLRPGDELLAVAGAPYDTLEEVIGTRGTPDAGSLAEFGVSYRILDLAPDGRINWHALSTAISPRTKVALIQRSCGYSLRPTLSIDEIERAVKVIKSQNPNVHVLVDNCYGEFTETREPPAVGADLCMGSLIKNPGGTIVSGGGYVAGTTELVERSLARMTAPGVGKDAGCVPGETLRLMFQGLYLAPQTVGEALKGGRLVAQVFSQRGMTVLPPAGDCTPWSFITAVRVGNEENMLSFCRAVQERSPVGAYVRPVPGITPGYGDEVIFADGTFIDGSTAELSADGPIREPYVVYCQGGTHWTQWTYVLEGALESMGVV